MTTEDRAIAAVRELGAAADRDAVDDPELLARIERRLADSATTGSAPRRRAPAWRRWPLAAVAAAVVVAGGAAATATVIVPDGGPAREEIDFVMKHEGVSEATALDRIAVQSKFAVAGPYLQAAAGEWYGGAWIDHDDDSRNKVALAAGAPAEVRERLAQRIADFGLAARTDIVTVPRREADLTALQARIDAELVAVNEGVEIYVNVEPDVRRGKLVLGRPVPHSATTPRQRAYLDSAAQRYGDVIEIRDGPGKSCRLIAGEKC